MVFKKTRYIKQNIGYKLIKFTKTPAFLRHYKVKKYIFAQNLYFFNKNIANLKKS